MLFGAVCMKEMQKNCNYTLIQKDTHLNGLGYVRYFINKLLDSPIQNARSKCSLINELNTHL